MALLSRSVFVLTLLLANACTESESLGSKAEWSALQGIEYDYRSEPVKTPIVRAISNYRVAGFPRTDALGTVWVLLNPENAPLYKQLPNGSYRLSASELAGLRVVQPVVLAELRARVRE